MDHRHLAIWMWTHRHSFTENSETSVDSGFSESTDHNMSDAPMLTAAQPLISYCPPSTSFGTTLIDINPLAASLLSMSPALIRPPPPYTPRAAHATHNDLLRMHNTPVIVEPDGDIDVVGDKDSSNSDSDNNDEPLDLTLNRAPLSPQQRPTVIANNRTRAIFRSASSASSVQHDVQEHFKRSLSGKWPRRAKTEEEKARASPMRRHTSFNSSTSTHVVCQVKQLSEIEDHFRRALGIKEFEEWKKKREAAEPKTDSENLI